MSDEALRLLDELHRERLDYDEYSLLHDTITDLRTLNDRLINRLDKIKELLDGERTRK